MDKLIQYRTHASLYDGAFDSTVGWSAAGMGYVLVTENKKLVVIDGGFGEDAENIISLLKENSKEVIPKVDLWIITHPHIDHYGAIREIANNEKYREQIKVEKILYWFPMEFCGKDGKPGMLAKANEHLESIVSVFDADNHRPMLDEKISVDSNINSR
jgi:glyoxylase-like metal-dependent hydrolase (beta-lactamase superfamily II)